MKPEVSETPNLFNYATSELSQDAVLCWMLDWINYNESEMKKLTLSFIDRIFELHNYKDYSSKDIKKACIKRQYRSIDILVEFYFNSNEVLYLIIEDKTDTVEHSEQLKRYKEKVEDLKNNQENSYGPIGIYYKSGFVFRDEKKKVENESFKIFDKAMMIEVMDKHENDIVSDIFNDYYSYLKSLQQREDHLVQIIEDNIKEEMKKVFKSAEGQWILASKMIMNMNNIKKVYKGKNRGGSPWTQFAINRSFQNYNLPDKIFYRIDRRKNGCYIALRQYLDLDSKKCKDFFKTADDTKILEHKKERLVRLRSCFTNAVAKLRNLDYYIEPGKTSNKGDKESEIGVFFIKENIDFKKIIKFIPELNEVFCSELEKEFDMDLFK